MAKEFAELQALIVPQVTSLGYEFVGCIYFPQGRHAILRVYIDSVNGVTVDDCERVSRQISAMLDVEDPITGTYTLEVSSPGLDRPLFTREHYMRFLGAKVHIRLHAPMDNRRQFKGQLLNVMDDNIVMECEGKEFALPLANIARANLIPEK